MYFIPNNIFVDAVNIKYVLISKLTSQTNKSDQLRLVFLPENRLLKRLLQEASTTMNMADPEGVLNSSTIETDVVNGNSIAGIEFDHSAVRLVF